MSIALICDSCKKAFSEHDAHHIEMKHTFLTTHYDLCPQCSRVFHETIVKDWKPKEETCDGKS